VIYGRSPCREGVKIARASMSRSDQTRCARATIVSDALWRRARQIAATNACTCANVASSSHSRDTKGNSIVGFLRAVLRPRRLVRYAYRLRSR